MAGGRHRFVDVGDELPDERGGLFGERLAVFNGEPAAAAAGLVLGIHSSAGRMPLMVTQ